MDQAFAPQRSRTTARPGQSGHYEHSWTRRDRRIIQQRLSPIETDTYNIVSYPAGRLKPELILLDIQLPVMDGHEVARWLKDQPETRDIPIVAVTSYAMPADRERVLANGCIGYIEKPIDLDTFVSGIERYLLTQEPDIGGGS